MNFKHVYLFLVLSGTFYWQINSTLIMSMRKTTLAPGQLLRSVHMEKSCLGKALYNVVPGVVQRVTRRSKLPPGQRKTHVDSYRCQTMHRGKVDPGVSELPRGNELSRDHVNRPLEKHIMIQTFS